MEIDDRVRVATPEGVDLDLVVVGLGSRFMSSLVDTTLQVVAIIPLLVGASVLGRAGVAVAGVGGLVVLFVLPTAFDAFAAGRTPGRRLAGLRLVTTDGEAVGLVPAAVRNVVRVIDFLPSLYAVGVVSVLATDRNQRLGDVAAGTMVVREARASGRRHAARGGSTVPGLHRPGAVPVAASVGWDVTGVRPADVEVVRSFLARREQLDPEARRRVGAELARRIAPLVVGPAPGLDDEELLEQVLAAREARR